MAHANGRKANGQARKGTRISTGFKGVLAVLVGFTSFLGCAAEPSDKTDDLAVARDMAAPRDLTMPKCSTNAECRSEFDRSAVCCPESKTCAPTREECPAVPDLAEAGDLSQVPDLFLEADLAVPLDLMPLACGPGRSDCDNNPANGCETDTNTMSNCGTCGNACDPLVGEVCVKGVCRMPPDLTAEVKDMKVGSDDAESSTDAGTTDAGTNDLAPPSDLSAPKDLTVTPKCDDKVKNGDETDTDCGGKCPQKCADGKGCLGGSDCSSGVCTNNVCKAPTCFDGIKNGTETDTDCGGSCTKCPDLKGCKVPGDCSSGVCTGGVCVSASCSDKVKNGKETDVDCGGSCPNCSDGKTCLAGGDCASGVCVGGKCQIPSCSDKVKNGKETDVDCGGSCSVCGNGKGCTTNSECASWICKAGTCIAATCQDREKNGAETDVDCGGFDPNSWKITCSRCPDHRTCKYNGDCQSWYCKAGVCETPSCVDGLENGSEPDVDCGRFCPNGCNLGRKCYVDDDCATSTYCIKQNPNDWYGRCSACPQGQTLCNGVCKDLTKDVSNCGACGKACAAVANGVAGCLNSTCGVGSCNQGFGNCDGNAGNGCETNTTTNASHCGKCANACPQGNTCEVGVCKAPPPPACQAPKTQCNGSCVDTATDAKNCGGCGKACLENQACFGGVCFTGKTVKPKVGWQIVGAVGPIGKAQWPDGGWNDWPNAKWEEKGNGVAITWYPGATMAAFNTQTVPANNPNWQLGGTWNGKTYCDNKQQIDSATIYEGDTPEKLGCVVMCSPQGHNNWVCK